LKGYSVIETLWSYLIFVAGLLLGYSLPDVDVAPILPLRHRSAWTHSPLLSFVAWHLSNQYPQYGLFFAGVVIAMAMHLLSDINPRKWGGSAMINLFPIPVSLPAWLSFIYIGIGVLGTVWVFMEMRQ
jgi:hypothetical protein